MLSIGLLYVVITLAGTLSMIFDVGALSYVPFLVERRHLAESNSKLQASIAVAGIAGPGVAGLLVGLITAPITLSVDAVSYLFSAGGLITIRKPEPEPEPAATRPSVRRSDRRGLRGGLRHPAAAHAADPVRGAQRGLRLGVHGLHRVCGAAPAAEPVRSSA